MAATTFPEVLWAQRSSKIDEEKNYIHMTINVPDVAKDSLKIDLQAAQINFTGTSSIQDKTCYHFELPLYAEIDPEASSTHYTPHSIKLKLQKKEQKEEFWPRLQKESQRLHWLKTDFERWVDEDEQEEAAEEDFSQFGGMGGMPGGGGMPGMGGMGGMGGGMPDMSAMGGMGGMGGGMPDMSALGGMGGMGGGMPDMSALGGMPGMEGMDFSKLAAQAQAAKSGETGGDDGSDDDMPGLEETPAKA